MGLMNRTVFVLAFCNCAVHSLVDWSSSEIYSLLLEARACDCTGHLEKSIFLKELQLGGREPKEVKLGGKELKSLCCQDLRVVTRNWDIPGGKTEMRPLIYMYVIYAVFTGMLAQSEELPLLLIFTGGDTCCQTQAVWSVISSVFTKWNVIPDVLWYYFPLISSNIITSGVSSKLFHVFFTIFSS